MRQEASWHVLWGVTCSLREPTLFLASVCPSRGRYATWPCDPSVGRRWHYRILFECSRLPQQGTLCDVALRPLRGQTLVLPNPVRVPSSAPAGGVGDLKVTVSLIPFEGSFPGNVLQRCGRRGDHSYM